METIDLPTTPWQKLKHRAKMLWQNFTQSKLVQMLKGEEPITQAENGLGRKFNVFFNPQAAVSGAAHLGILVMLAGLFLKSLHSIPLAIGLCVIMWIVWFFALAITNRAIYHEGVPVLDST